MNRLNFLISSLLVLSLTTLSVSCCSTGIEEKGQTIVEKHGKLSVKGTQLVDERGEPVVLRGVSFGWHIWWSDFYNPKAVNTLVNDWKSTLLRVSVGVGPEGDYIDNPELAIKSATTVIDAAIKEGVYVIIDWHSHDIKLEPAKEFFTLMGHKYKDCPNIIYEIFNEPDYEIWDEVKAYSVEVIKTIRAIAPENIIIVGLPHWDQDVHIVADDPITGYNNLMYALHFYAATHKRDLRARGEYALSKGLPLFVSECAGMEATGDGPIDTEQWNTWVQWMNKYNISWAAWSISGKDESCSMLRTTTTPDGEWTDCELKEWAHIVRNRLRIDNK